MYHSYLNSPLLPDDDEQADMYLYTVEALSHYGYKQYEISNFAVPGYESRHNLKYWQLDDYMGFGRAHTRAWAISGTAMCAVLISTFPPSTATR